MNTIKWVLVGLIALEALLAIRRIGKERDPLTPGAAIGSVIEWGIIATLVVLRDAMIQDKFTDDRPPRSAPFLPALNDTAAALLVKHADKHPRHYTIADSER